MSQIYLYSRFTRSRELLPFSPRGRMGTCFVYHHQSFKFIPLMLRTTSPLPPSSLFSSQLRSTSNGLCTSHRCSSFVSYNLPSARRHCTSYYRVQWESTLMQDCRINPHATAELGPVSRRAWRPDIPLGHTLSNDSV